MPTGHGLSILTFLSTLSLRRATQTANNTDNATSISIHALLAESDSNIKYRNIIIIIFLSTLSLRRATKVKESN